MIERILRGTGYLLSVSLSTIIMGSYQTLAHIELTTQRNDRHRRATKALLRRKDPLLVATHKSRRGPQSCYALLNNGPSK